MTRHCGRGSVAAISARHHALTLDGTRSARHYLRMAVFLSVARDLPCPASAAFALATDAERFPGFFTGFGPIPALRRITLHGPLGVGSTRRVDSSDGSALTERIVAHAPSQHHAYVLSGLRPPLGLLVREGRAEWHFVPRADSTRVTWTYRFELTTLLAWPLAAPLLHVFMRGAMRRCLEAMAAGCAQPVAVT